MVTIEEVRKLSLALPDAVELPHFERTSFRIKKKIFSTLDVKENRACLMLSEIDQSVFSAYDNTIVYPVPNAWGKKGATYFELKKVRKSVLKDALQKAYDKATASKLKKKSS
jgi:hypothetical protein